MSRSSAQVLLMVFATQPATPSADPGCRPRYPLAPGRLTGGARYLRLAGALGLGLPLLVQGAPPPSGTATLNIRVEARTVEVELTAAALTLLGFTGKPADAAQQGDLRLAVENLRQGQILIRFNPQAGCVLEHAKVDGDPRGPANEADLGARYRFACTFPGSLQSAALGLFTGFPALRRVYVRYLTSQGRGEAVLTPGNPVVSFVPFP